MNVTATPIIWWVRTDVSEPRNFLVQSPARNSGFIERRQYRFNKPGEDWTFLIDDEPLADLADVPDMWTWSPGFYAGEVTAQLAGPGGQSSLFLLDVGPEPSKLGRESFDQMLDEVWAEDPNLVIGSEPAGRSIGDLGTDQNAWLE